MNNKRKTLIAIAAAFSVLAVAPASASAGIFRKKKAEPKKELTAEQKDSVELSKIIGDAKHVSKGMFDCYTDKDGKLLIFIPDSALNDEYLLASRVSGISDTGDFVAGQMNITPLPIRFSKDEHKLYIHLLQDVDVVADSDPIKPSFDRNMLDPVVRGFKIKNHAAGGSLVDFTDFFAGNEKLISPIKDEDPIVKALSGRSGIEGTFYSDGSAITAVKSFPDNVMVESRLAYTTRKATAPYTVMVSRSLLRLPKEKMKSRLQDNRVGYFYDTKRLYSSDLDKMETYNILNRFRVEPSEKDLDRYFAGELVEPRKKIIFYVDSAFPEKWAKAVKEGIEYWNIAFEAAGFKNVIEARDYPKDNPEFDPDDVRFNCVRYCVTPTANAMGPSYCDPRTGEILGADVIWYHNVLSLVHNWRFAQTAAVDPRVRKSKFDDDVMHESLTYVTAHEIGHCLGLMHNMGASYAYSVADLRNPEFTQKYGTTPSIMDYARNNFVAQPGDLERGVRLTPPPVGVYDIHAINYGYRLIPEAETPFDEKPTLDRWIEEKKGDPMYEFGAQQVFGLADPTDQTEDLGNDHMLAGDMAISNLKIIMNNFEDWAGEPGRDYRPLLDTYKAVVSQYMRHIGHVVPYIGGVKYSEIRQGRDKGTMREYISKKDTRRAFDWLLNQARSCDWLDPQALTDKFEDAPKWRENMQKGIVGCVFSAVNLNRINSGYKIDPANHFSPEEFIDYAIAGFFAPTANGKSLGNVDKNLQMLAVDAISKGSGLPMKGVATGKSAVEVFEEEVSGWTAPAIPCSFDCGHRHSAASPSAEEGYVSSDETRSFFRLVMGDPALPVSELQPMLTSKLKHILALYRSAKAPDKDTRNFYDWQIRRINSYLEPGK